MSLEQRGRLDRRERRGRLVEDGDPMRNGQRAGDLRELALGDGQPLDGHGDRGLDAEDAHRLGGAAVHLPVVESEPAPDLAAEKHVLGDRQIRRQHDLLVDQHDAAPLGVDRTFQFDRRAVELDDAAGRREVAAEDLHQGRLAGAVLADDRVDLAGADADRHVAQDLDRPERSTEADRFQNRTMRATLALIGPAGGRPLFRL